MFINAEKRKTKKIALAIEKIVDLQIQQELFSEMSLSKEGVLRAKICLTIYNFAYLIYFINISEDNYTKIKTKIDDVYDIYYSNLKQKYLTEFIRVSDIVVNKIEQAEVCYISKKWLMDYTPEVMTSLSNLFPMLYEIRIPFYLEKIRESWKSAREDIAFPFLPVASLFKEHFLSEDNEDFIGKFDMIINVETLKRIIEIVKQTN